ncbi:MAG: hypothetical protein BWX73_02258 [Lentisphaerae bacterium ADurb.Bin082]|nr:MAG: hypothetical protein BWX73_02258 [Lentisphaerae bacterium ADurb.Bin082]
MKTTKTSRLVSCFLVMSLWLVGSLSAADSLQPKEKNVYIPYEKLWETFEQDKRGVFLPHDEFERLWQKAYGTPETPPVKPPRDAVIARLQGEILVGEDTAEAKVTMDIEVFAKGWVLLPLAMSDCAMIDPAIQGLPDARIIHDRQQGYALLASNQQEASQKAVVTLRWVREISKTPGRNSLTFQAPDAPVNQWEVVIPVEDAQVEVSGDRVVKEQMTAKAGFTKVRLHVGANSQPVLAWTPKAEGAKGLDALINVTSLLDATLEEGMIRTQAHVTFAVSRAPVAALAILFPREHRVTNVFDPNIREWRVSEQGEEQRLDITLHEPVTAEQAVILELERIQAGLATADIPCLKVPAAIRQQGVLAVFIGEGLKAEVGPRTGLTQLDVNTVRTMESKRIAFAAYQYAGIPWSLQIAVEPLHPQVFAQAKTTFNLELDHLLITSTFTIEARKAGIFQLDFDVPADFKLVECQALSGADPVVSVLADRQLGEASQGRQPLRLTFKAKQHRLNVLLLLRRELSEAALLTPGLPPFSLTLAGPRLAPGSVEREEGAVAIQAPASLRVTPGQTSHLKAVDGDGASLLAYRFNASEPLPQLTITAERRPPHCTVTQMLLAGVESGNQLKYTAMFKAEVIHSGVKSLAFAVPAALLPRLQLTPSQYRLQPAEKQPTELPEGYQAVNLQGDAEFFGASYFSMRWTEDLGDLPVGGEKSISLPRLIAFGDRVWGQIAFLKNDMIDMAPTAAEKLLPIDPRFNLIKDIAPVQPKAPGTDFTALVARAFEYHSNDWKLEAKVTRYQNEAVKSTSIEKMLVRAVLTRSGAVSVQTACQMRSTRQRLELHLPDGVEFDSAPALVDGRPAPLEKGEPGQYFVPLTANRQGERFILELRYVLPKPKTGIFQPPAFPDDAAVQHVYLSVHIPKNLTVLGTLGLWNVDNIWALSGFLTLRPRARMTSSELVGWLLQGASANPTVADHLNSFVTDGQPLLYSTLHPPAGQAGALRLRLWSAWQCKAILIIAILAVGVLLARATVFHQALSLAFAISGLALLAVFLPSLAVSLVSNAAAAAALIVLLGWGFLWFRRRPPKPPRLPSSTPPPNGDQPASNDPPTPLPSKTFRWRSVIALVILIIVAFFLLLVFGPRAVEFLLLILVAAVALPAIRRHWQTQRQSKANEPTAPAPSPDSSATADDTPPRT